MKKILAIIMVFMLMLSGCGVKKTTQEDCEDNKELVSNNANEHDNEDSDIEDIFLDNTYDRNVENLNQDEMNQFIADEILIEMEKQFESDEISVESVDVIYLSKEYVDELNYNSKKNIFFGYTLSELDTLFGEEKYVFTLGESGETTVSTIENNNEYLNTIIKNVAVGAGVLVVLVTVSVATSGTGTGPVVQLINTVCVAGAQYGTLGAALGTCVGGIGAGIAEYMSTGDSSKIQEASLLGASYGFEIGAIVGAAVGMGSKGYELYQASKTTLNPYVAEKVAADYYKGSTQKAFKDGIEVSITEKGHTRPDVIRMVGDKLEAIEVKTYDLSSSDNRKALCYELKRQVRERISHLPDGSLQRIALNVQGRGYDSELIEKVVQMIRISVNQYYPNIPIDVFDGLSVISY